MSLLLTRLTAFFRRVSMDLWLFLFSPGSFVARYNWHWGAVVGTLVKFSVPFPRLIVVGFAEEGSLEDGEAN